MIAYLLMGLCLTLASQAPAKDSLSVEQVTQANAAAVASIRSLIVRCTYLQQMPEQGSDGVPKEGTFKTTDVYTYTWRGDEERLQLDRVAIRPTADGDKPGLSDIYNGPKGLKSLIGYDRAAPPELGEYSTSAVAGYVGDRQSNKFTIGLNVKSQMMLEVVHGVKSWPLSELVKTATTTRITAQPSSSPRGCFELEVVRPEAAFAVSVDPTANFMIRRMSFRPTAKSKIKADGFLEVKRFQDCGDGVYIPVEIAGQMSENGATMRVRVTYEVISCNKDLPADAFDVKFPDWLRVLDRSTGKVYIWGPEDKPRRTFATYQEYLTWNEPRFAKAKGLDRDTHLSRRGWVLLLLVNLATIIAAVIFVIRRRQRPTSPDSHRAPRRGSEAVG